MMQYSSKMLAAALAATALTAGAQAAVVVTDNGTTAPTGFATGYTGAMDGRFGLGDVADESFTQSFTLTSAITLDSIYWAYNGFYDAGAIGDVQITVDAGNDASAEITEVASLASADFSGSAGDTASSPVYWMQWDLSSHGLDLAAGQHSFTITLDPGDITNPDGWLIAPMYINDDTTYAGGDMTISSSGNVNDAGFAVSGDPVPEPGSLALLGLGGLALLRRRRA